MANANFSLGQVNITDFLIVQFRKVSTPTVIAASQVFAPPQPTTRNISFTGLDPTTYYVDFRESSDGISLGLLLASYVYDVKNQMIVAEFRYYLVDGGGAHDPASGQDTLTDPYLNGKTIQSIYKEGFRPLVPPSETFKEYDLVAGGGFKLLNGQLFSGGEVVVVWIAYTVSAPSSTSAGAFKGVKLIDVNTTLDATYYGYRIKCHSTGSRLVVTFPALASIPDETPFYFTTNKGSQFQTRFLTTGGELFEFAGDDLQEITMGKGEQMWIVKNGSRFEVIDAHANAQQVGQRFPGTWKDHVNTMPEDGRLLDGDDYPRPWWWISAKLPATHYIVDDAVVGGGYLHPAGKEGLFVIHSTLKKFRMPNTQGWSEKGLADFDTYGADAGRTYDYPGGSQAGQVGQFTGTIPIRKGNSYTGGPNNDIFGNGSNGLQVQNLDVTFNAAKENQVKNIGVIHHRRI